MSPGDRIRQARLLLEPNLPTKELDWLAGLTSGHIWNIEKHGGANIESSRLDRIARVLGVTLDWLVRGEGEPPTAESVAAAVASAREARPRGTAATGSDGAAE